MKFQPKEDYTSSWEWTRAHSKYHFDYTRYDQPGEWYWPLGQMQGADWTKEVQQAINNNLDTITWATRKYGPYYDLPDGTKVQSEMLAQEENDLREAGAPADLALTDIVEEDRFGPALSKIVDYWGLEDPWCRLHIQKPGQMFNLHIDKLWDRCPDDPERICRIIVFLADWEPGQFFCHGTHQMSHWRAGDVMTFDWPNVPHASANASRSVRPTLMMTGLKTDVTRERLKRAGPNTVHYL